MKNSRNPFGAATRARKSLLAVGALMAFSVISSTSCASSPTASPPNPPSLEQQKLRPSIDRAGFQFDYQVCVKKFLGVCVKREMHRDFWDWTDPKVRQKFSDMGFVLMAREAQ
jgi:hypothetical protein